MRVTDVLIKRKRFPWCASGTNVTIEKSEQEKRARFQHSNPKKKNPKSVQDTSLAIDWKKSLRTKESNRKKKKLESARDSQHNIR